MKGQVSEPMKQREEKKGLAYQDQRTKKSLVERTEPGV